MKELFRKVRDKAVIFSPLGLCSHVAAKLGCKVFPFHVYLNNAGQRDLPVLPAAKYEAFTFAELTEQDLPALCALPCRKRDPERVLALYRSGSRCYALLRQQEICSYVWVDYSYFKIAGRIVGRLAPDEAFFFDSYTVATCRGQGLSPYLFLKIYESCRARGRSKFYIFCSVFNKSAKNVYAKLRPATEGVAWHIDLWGVYRRDILPPALGRTENRA